MIVALIRPEHLRSVRQALKMTKAGQVTVRRRKPHPDHRANWPKLRLEAYSEDTDVDEIVQAVRHASVPGGPGAVEEGRIFVVSLDECNDLGVNECTVLSPQSL
ncbi:MAG TPA: P-II family nitrogen regulator [Gemmataceae bacterium]|nr:P-II family nitrogen regulator [Gemmataceae bacterium]